MLGPRIRHLRERLLASGGDNVIGARLKRISAVSAIVQMVILAETLAILVLAADLIV